MLKKILICVPFVFSSGLANAGAMAGGSSEITQIANNIELMMGVSESARQTAVQMNTLQTALKNVQGMGGLSGVENKMGLPPGSLSKAAKASGSVKDMKFTINGISTDSDSLSDRSKLLAATYKGAMKMYEKTGKLPSEVVDDINKQPKEEAKIQKKIVKNTSKQIDGTIKDLDNVNKQARGIPSITGNVKGLQFLAAQNVEINRSLKETNLTLLQSEKTKALEKQRAAEKEAFRLARKRQLEKADQKRFKNVTTINNDTWARVIKSGDK